jgi:hypothetical protein
MNSVNAILKQYPSRRIFLAGELDGTTMVVVEKTDKTDTVYTVRRYSFAHGRAYGMSTYNVDIHKDFKDAKERFYSLLGIDKRLDDTERYNILGYGVY